MNLKNLSNAVLLTETKKIALQERDTTLRVLHHLREVERRMLYAVKFSSLFAYCVGELGYDAAGAQLRISSMRLIKELPELEEKVTSGDLNLSLLAQAQSFFKKEKITASESKKEIVAQLSGKSTREAQRELLNRAVVPEIHRPEKVRAVSTTHSEVRFLADEELLQDIETLKSLLSHALFNASLKDLFKRAVKDSIQIHTPKKPALRAQNEAKRQSPAQIKRVVWQRDEGRCTHEHQGHRCNSRYLLEYDHLHPVALGGATTVDNLRLRCRTHNQLAAVECLGARKMANFIPALR